MKVLWVSPNGDGWSIAYKMKQDGHKVVLYTSPENRNALGYLVRATKGELENLVRKSDLVVVDGNYPSRRTRRSWEPSDAILDLNAMVKKRGVPYIGPTPTTELLSNDLRYQRKVLARCGMPGVSVEGRDDSLLSPDTPRFSGEWEPRFMLSIAPDGGVWLCLRHRRDETILADQGLGSVNLSDLVLKIPRVKLFDSVAGNLEGFLRSIGHSGYINLDLAIDGTEARVKSVDTGILFPAGLVQFAASLSGFAGGKDANLGGAVTIEQCEPNHQRLGEMMSEGSGFFPLDLQLQGDQVSVNGSILGAIVGLGETFWGLHEKLEAQLRGLAHTMWNPETIIHTISELYGAGWFAPTSPSSSDPSRPDTDTHTVPTANAS